MTELDIQDLKQGGDELKQAIVKAVKDTQLYLTRPLPDLLIMTREQYEELEDDPQMVGLKDWQSRMYVTQYNAMELDVR